MGWKEDAIQCAIDAEAHERAERERLAREATQRRIDAAVVAANHVGIPIEDFNLHDYDVSWTVEGIRVRYHPACDMAVTLYHSALGDGNRLVRDKRQLGDALRDIAKWEEKNGKPVQEEA